MSKNVCKQATAFAVLVSLACIAISCATSRNEVYFGKTVPPSGNILRYVTGDEPESLDPPVSTGQPEARIFMALFDGLVDYDPKTLAPAPALATHWFAN